MMFARTLAALALAAFAHVAAAAAPPSVFLEELTWTELRDAVAAGRTTVIVPVGGTEQSGPHIVLGKHNVRVRILAGRIATALGDALVAPVVAYVPEGAVEPASGHMRFPGTISVPEPVFEATLEGAARSLRHAGFRDIVLIGDHGGYQKSLAKVASALDRAWAKDRSPARVHAIDEYYAAADRGVAELLRKQGLSDAAIGSHAGAADTSLALAADEHLVRPLHDGASPSAAEGVSGDPRRASVAAGRAGLDLIVARTRDAIARAVQRR